MSNRDLSPELEPEATIEIDLDAPDLELDTSAFSTSPSKTSSSPTGFREPTPKARTASSSSTSASGTSPSASRVRGAAAMWENKLSSSTQKSPTATRQAASPTKRGATGRTTPTRSNSNPLGSSQNSSTSSRKPVSKTVTPPTSFKSTEPKNLANTRKGKGRRSPSPPPPPPVPSVAVPPVPEPSDMLPERSSSRAPAQSSEDHVVASTPLHPPVVEVTEERRETSSAGDDHDGSKASIDLDTPPRTPPPVTPPKKDVSLAPDDFADVPLATPTPSPAPQSRFPSLFSRVLPGYGTANEKTEKASPEKGDLPELPSKDKSRENSLRDGDVTPKEISPPTSASKERAPSNSSATKAGGFFSSATSAFNNIQLPSVSLPALASPGKPQANGGTPPNEPASAGSSLAPAPAVSGSSWRSTMSHFLQRGSSPQPTTPPPMPVTPSRNNSTSGVAALLIKRFDSPTASRDRRLSREQGGGERVREGFERVRNEMEGAARDIRTERRGRGESLDVEHEVDWVFWGAVVQDYEEVARTRPKDLSRAIQQGIPAVIRGPIWQLMSSSKSIELEETYKALLKLHSPHEKAIQKDLSRTFPHHKFFQGTGAGQEGLFMVVKAYSLYDQEVGYTQGLPFIVAALLLNMPDEEAFCVLVRLMDSYNLRSHYLADMPGLQLRLYQFDRLVEEIIPLLHNHLVRKGIKSSMFASQWFMTLFSYRFPLSLVYRVLDIVLAEGIEAVFRFALALLRNSEDELLQLEFEQILAYLQGDLYEGYRATPSDSEGGGAAGADGGEEWRANDFVRDAYEVRITPLMLDQYEYEWNEKCRAQTAHTRELEQLRHANRHLSAQVKTLEASLATMNTEHVELVRQLVLAKIAKEDMENELVRYKSMCAQLSQGSGEFDSPTLVSRGSNASLMAQHTPSPRAASPVGSVQSALGLSGGAAGGAGAAAGAGAGASRASASLVEH